MTPFSDLDVTASATGAIDTRVEGYFSSSPFFLLREESHSKLSFLMLLSRYTKDGIGLTGPGGERGTNSMWPAADEAS